jgi:hypothetical protein
MFQHLNFLLFFLLSFAATTDAQWGTVVAQNDTNRFITSQYKYGLLMPHQDIIVGKLDTTISSAGTNGGGGYKVIVGSLLNWDDNCVGGNRWQGRWDCSGSHTRRGARRRKARVGIKRRGAIRLHSSRRIIMSRFRLVRIRSQSGIETRASCGWRLQLRQMLHISHNGQLGNFDMI